MTYKNLSKEKNHPILYLAEATTLNTLAYFFSSATIFNIFIVKYISYTYTYVFMWVYTIRLTWPKLRKKNNAHLYLWRTLCAFSNHLPTLEVITVLTYTIKLQKSKEMINNVVSFLFFFTQLYVCDIHAHWTDLLCNLKYVKMINLMLHS